MLQTVLVSPGSSVDVPGAGSGGDLVWRVGAASPPGAQWSLAAPGESVWTGPRVGGEPADLVTAVIRPVTDNTNVNELMLEIQNEHRFQYGQFGSDLQHVIVRVQ